MLHLSSLYDNAYKTNAKFVNLFITEIQGYFPHNQTYILTITPQTKMPSSTQDFQLTSFLLPKLHQNQTKPNLPHPSCPSTPVTSKKLPSSKQDFTNTKPPARPRSGHSSPHDQTHSNTNTTQLFLSIYKAKITAFLVQRRQVHSSVKSSRSSLLPGRSRSLHSYPQ